MGHCRRSSKREAYSNTILPQETIRILDKQSNLTHKATIKEEQAKPKANRRKEIIKIRAEINEMEKKKTVATVKLNTVSLRR